LVYVFIVLSIGARLVYVFNVVSIGDRLVYVKTLKTSTNLTPILKILNT
jgi:hypothetical protein